MSKIHQIRAQERDQDQAQIHVQVQEADPALALDQAQVFPLAVLEKARRKEREGKQTEGKAKWKEKCVRRKILSFKRLEMI